MPIRPVTRASMALALLGLAAAATAADKPAAPQSAQPQTRPGLAALARPDLVVTIDGGGTGLPKSFTVKNVGTVDSKLSVLKVSAVFVPADGPLVGGASYGSNCPPPMKQSECDAAIALGTFLGIGGGGTSSKDPKAACGEPFKDIVEAVPVLKPGESKTFTRDTGPSSILIGGVLKQGGSAQATHVKLCSPTIVCAFDIVAKADASNDNDELNRANNTATRRAYREIRFQ